MNLNETKGIDALLKEFEGRDRNNVDKALYHLLVRFKDELPPLDCWFHRSFRISDCVDGHIDIAIWCLLDQSNLFWELFEKYKIDSDE